LVSLCRYNYLATSTFDTVPLTQPDLCQCRVDPSHYATAQLISPSLPDLCPLFIPPILFVRSRNEQSLAGCNSISRIQMKGKLNLLFCRNNPHFFYSVFTSLSSPSERIKAKANSESLRIARNYQRNIPPLRVG